MFVFSVKATRRHLLLTALSVAAVTAILIAAWVFPAERTMLTVGTTADGSDDTACAAYLRSLGYAAQLPAAEVREIRIPDMLDSALSAYNDLQKAVGFDLSGFVGMRLKYRTYHLEDGAVAHLYVYNNTIIGGDIVDGSGHVLPLEKSNTMLF